MSLCSTLAACAVTLAAALADDEENLLRNGGFEKGGRSLADWQTIFPPSLATPRPTFSPTEEDPREGERAASIVVEYKGGYTSLTQSLPVPEEARTIHLSCWARIDAPGEGAASMLVWFSVPGSAQGGSMAQSQRLTEQREWTQLTVDAAIPEGAKELIVRCGVYGPCSASFDDAAATWSAKESVVGKLAVAHGDYTAKATGKQDQPWVRMSIPFPIGGQTPLAVRVTSEPEDAVVALAVHAERENRPLEVRLRPMSSGDAVKLRVETLALLRDRPLSDGKGVALSGRRKAPKDVKVHLDPAPGIDADDNEVKKIAKTLPEEDLFTLMSGLQELLREKLEYAGGEDQGSTHCLQSGKAVCTGYANTAAALLIARGVPTRVLACLTLGSRLQEHYIVEAWTPEHGWSRMESTMTLFPWADSKNLVLRIVYPDAPRSVVNVPLYSDACRNVSCSFRMGSDTCWQGGNETMSFALGSDAVTSLEELTRDAFEEWTRTATDGTVRSLLDHPDAHEVLAADCADILEMVTAWIEEPGQLDG